ncbi:hypothetical protein PMY12_14680 [Clostridium tertium]|uniref:hypothetical protein n=1 Tax=Clostridium tertium TaxID=1559 RepID=UPI00232CE6C7|nr:hypothetical protein [Clostridium tertium]MDB1931705.1 hypothetical protein [Clostridium tertium]MDB1938249.1 hypothetical protein [Clostridium tertium]MDU1566448.1 hypothetical protein [Clostridium sp.]
MITDRDKEVIKCIEEYKAITLRQATEVFFKGNYKGASRRMAQLEEMGVLKSYISKSKKEKVYYQEKKVNDHRLYIYDYLKELKRLGCDLIDIKIEPEYLKGLIRPDAYVLFRYEDYKYITLLEVDYTHYTSNIKMNTLYEKLYSERENYKDFFGTFPIVVIARSTKGIRYNSGNFEVIYTDLSYSNLEGLLLQ